MKLVTEPVVVQALFTIPLALEMRSVKTVRLEPSAGAFMANDEGVEFCPPLDTVMEAVPAETMRLALTAAVN